MAAVKNKSVQTRSAALPSAAVSSALVRLFPNPNPFASDPVGWMHDKLGRCLWAKQVEILEALREHRLVAVQSCHGPGKTFTASGAGAWWLDPDTHPLGSAFLVSTAPSWPQVEAILWRELRRRHREGNLRGRITLDCQWHMGDVGTKRADTSEELIGMGRKPADYDDYTFQGIHARYFMGLLDEAGGIPESLWVSILALATNQNARVLAIGNPDDPNSHFAVICRPGSGWKVIKISAFETPHFTEDYNCAVCGKMFSDEMLESLVGPMYVEQARREWGEGSPLWVSKVLGEFPDISDEYLISPSLIEKCRMIELVGLERGRFGVDVSRMGRDKTVVYRNRGGVIRLVAEWAKTDTMETAGRVANILQSVIHPVPVPANIDIIGVGSGVFDRLREQNYQVSPHQGSSRALNPAKFKNRRSEVWWTFREQMEEGLIDLDPEDDVLAAQLGSIKWGTDSAGRIYVETKEDMEARGMPSPNHADAAVMALADIGTVPLRTGPSGSIAGDILTKVL